MKWLLMGLIIWCTLSIPVATLLGRIMADHEDEG